MKKMLLVSLFIALNLNPLVCSAAAEPEYIWVKGADEDVPAESNTCLTNKEKTKLFTQLEGKKFRCFESIGNVWKKCPGIWLLDDSDHHKLTMSLLS